MSAELATDRRIGERIRQRRLELGLTQQELAQALGCSYQQLQKFENGTNRITAVQLHALGRRMAVAIGWFFDEDEATAAVAASLDEHGGRQRAAIDIARSIAVIRSQEIKLALAGLARAIAERQPRQPDEVRREGNRPD